MPEQKVIEAITDGDLAGQLVFLQQASKMIADEIKSRKLTADEQFARGATVPANVMIEHEEITLGKVSKSNPERQARVVDREAFTAYLLDSYADDVQSHWEIGATEEVIPVLMEHAPELLTLVENVIPAWLESNVLKLAVVPSAPKIPGVVIENKPSTISITLRKEAKALVQEFLSKSPVQFLALAAAPAGDSE